MTGNYPFGLRLPVVAAPMFLISGPDLVVAACEAGVMGSFPTPNCRTLDQLDEWMDTIVTRLDGARAAGQPVAPWAANLVTHRTNSRLAEDLALVARHKPPLVITALGSPIPAIETVKSYGGQIYADVGSIALAKKAADAGVDGLALLTAGAGGHTGHLSPFAFVSAVREFFDGALVLSGGIADGHGVAGAIAAGADLVYMGTRFLAAEESLAPDAYKQMIVDHGPDDLIVSAAITGTAASWLRPSLIECGFDPDNLQPPAEGRNYDSGNTSQKRWKDVWAAGQGLGAITAVQSTAAIVDDLERQFAEATARFKAITA
ncbi:NAD(P)H-dependent flavin oxidoreductase [Allosphingosinicella indica]|uniref:Nitronate monooxygenase n=1 Tax=Allosphingosinicella indica TaxID=941907 RepID=A0A1X7G1E4_9SPHN|nr:nitronate monooxygenase [Allosphingosinicella indica]SMF61703.1 nitronate monooxygenase [Allosphingosinicella indica]